jgi:hypothetical protein
MKQRRAHLPTPDGGWPDMVVGGIQADLKTFPTGVQ